MQVALSALVILCSHALLAANHFWSTNWSDNANTGCGFVDKSITLANSAGCFSMNSSVRLQYSSYTPSTNWGTIYQVNSGGHGSTINFSAHMLQTGYYRVIVSGGESPAGACGGHSYRADTSHVLSVTVYSVNANVFNINGNTNVSPTSIQTYACNPINLNYVPLSGVTITNYKLTVQAANASGTPTSGGYNSNPSATWAGSAIPSTINLNTGANATAFSAGGYFLVTLQTQSTTCTSVARKALIFVTASVAAPFANFKINNATPNNCGSPLQTYDCAPITLTNFSTGAVSYKVDLFTAPISCPNGTYSHVHSTGVVTTFPTDAKNLPGPGTTGTWLQTHTGYYAIIVTAYNACGTYVGSQSLYFNVLTGPTGASAAFTTAVKTKLDQTIQVESCLVPVNQQFTYHDGNISCGGPGGWFQRMEHTSVATPNKVGRTGTTFKFDNISGGTGSYSYNVRIKAESWNGSTWTLMGTDPTGEDLGQAPDNIELEDIVNGAFDDETLTPNGNIYRITVYVINACGTVSTTQIIQIDDVRLRLLANDSDLTISEDAASIGLQAYPNPATDEFNFSFTASKEDVVNIALYDLSGRKALDVVQAAKATEGENNYKSPLNGLSAGSYIYKVQINDTVFTGKMIKK